MLLRSAKLASSASRFPKSRRLRQIRTLPEHKYLCRLTIPEVAATAAERRRFIEDALTRLTIPEVAATAAALLEPFEHQQLPQSPATAMPGRPSDRAPAKAVSANFVLSKQIYDASVREAERRHCRARTPSPHSGAVVAISRIVPF